MKLTLEQLQSVSLGAVRVAQYEDGVHFFRFTKAQEALYDRTAPGVTAYARSVATAGVRLRFKTNSTSLGMVVNVAQKTSRSYFSVDIVVNGTAVGYIDNFGDTVLQGNPSQAMPLGRFGGTFPLGNGEKDVCIHLPWSVCAAVEELTLDDGASLIPVKPVKRVLVLGDSITQGYDALRPSHRYAGIMCDRLGAEEVNKAIGGECFFPPLAATPDAFTPDLITVAYGTNDWSNHTNEQVHRACRGFFEELTKSYPQVPIVAITPIWRKDCTQKLKFGPFEQVGKCIRKEVAHLPNVQVVDAYDFVPHSENYFADLCLHPNDEGFVFYTNNICQALSTLF